MKVGINTDILDNELGVCNKTHDLIANREALINKLVKKKLQHLMGALSSS